MNGLWSVVYKEFLHLRRDATTAVISLLIPLLQICLFGFAIDLDIRHIPAVVVDYDRSSDSRQYLEKLRSTEYLDLTYRASNEKEAVRMLRDGRARVAVIVPPDFAREIQSKRTPQIGVLLDGSDSTVATRARLAFVRPPGSEAGQVEARTTTLFNPTTRTATFMIPALIGLVMQLVTVSLTSFSLVREREQGTLEQLMVSPVGRLALMVGKTVPYAALAFFELILILVFSWFVFDIEVRGSIVGLLAMSIPFILASLGLGLLISTVAQNQAQALQLSMLTMMPSFLLSGFFFPRETMPGFIYLISEILPLTHFLQVLRGVIVRGAGFADMLPQFFALCIISALLLLVSTAKFRKSVA